MVGSVQQHVTLGRYAAGGEPVQVIADHGPGVVEGLRVGPAVAAGRALLRVHHVHHPSAVRGEPGGGRRTADG